MGAITDLLQSLSVTSVTPEKKPGNRLQAAPSVAVTPVTSVTLNKTISKAETAQRQVLTFTIDGSPTRITAIDMVARTQNEAVARLGIAWGQRLDCVWSADGCLIYFRRN